MLGTRHEEYGHFSEGLPFILHVDLKRTPHLLSTEQNWHDDLEIQLCTGGHGEVLLGGESIPFSPRDVVVVNANVIHYTGTTDELTYTCLIVSAEFCRKIGIDCHTLWFSPLIRSEQLIDLMTEMTAIYKTAELPFRTARLNEKLLSILTLLATHHTEKKSLPPLGDRGMKNAKDALRYVRENFNQKLSLDGIARAVYTDKYTLCRDFKRFTGQTVVEYINRYRCQRAAEHIVSGKTVVEAAHLCRFDNLSFFAKIFKRYMGALPSSYKK